MAADDDSTTSPIDFVDPAINVPLNNVRHERFCQQYIVDLAGSKSAVRAGYSVKSAGSIATALLARPDIKARVAVLQEASRKRLEITADRIRNELAKLAFSNMADYTSVTEEGEYLGVNLAEIDRDTMAAVSSLETETVIDPSDPYKKRTIQKNKIKLHDKRGALDSLAKLTGLDKGVVTLQNPDGSPITPHIKITIVDPKPR